MGIRIKRPFRSAVIFIHPVVKMRREFSRGARRSVPGTADRADHLSGFDDLAFMHTFCKAVQVSEVVIRVIDIPDADSPAAETVPALHFNNTVAGRSDGEPVMSEQIRSFVNPAPAETPCGAPCACGSCNPSSREAEKRALRDLGGRTF